MDFIQKLDTVWFQVQDMERSLTFYRDVLGLECSYQSEYWSSLRVGDSQIGLHGPSDASRPAPVAGWVVSLLTNDLAALKTTLLEAGATFESEYHDTPRGAVLSFQDPDGNRLQAMQLGAKSSELH